jgi:hypothetical protein
MIAYDRLSQIIPPDMALANKALTVALQQISGISNMNLPSLANTVVAVNTNAGLPAINNQTQPVNNSTRSYLLSQVGIGTGPCGSITTMDCLGTAAGWVTASNLVAAYSVLHSMNTGGLQGAYQQCLDCMHGVYTTQYLNPNYPSTQPQYYYKVILPHGGTFDNQYPTAAAAQTAAIGGGCIPYIQGQVSATAGAYPSQVSKLNSDFGNICQQMGNEQDLQHRAGLNFADNFANLQAASQTADFSFVMSLPTYGQDVQVGGAAQFLEAIANTTNQGGQAIVATMRQGRTDSALNTAGILSASDIPLIPSPSAQQANLLPSTYTVQQAVANISY